MNEPIKEPTLEEKMETINANLKPLYKARYDQNLLLEAIAMMLGLYGDDDSALNDADKRSKEFQTIRRAEVEKQMARDSKMIKFFEDKLKPILEEQQRFEDEAKKSTPMDHPNVTEPAPNGKRDEPIGEPK